MDFFMFILMLMGLFAVMLIVIGSIVLYVRKFKYTVVIKKLTAKGTKKFVIKRLAREIKDKKNPNVTYFKIGLNPVTAFKHKYPMPPPDAIEMTHKGAFFVMAYMNELEEICYAKDSGSPNFFQSLNTNQRMIIIEELQKAADRRPLDWLNYIPIITGGLILIFGMVITFNYWEDIHKPSVMVAGNLAGVSKEFKETAAIMQDILQDKQTFLNFYYGNWSETPPTPPPN